ncbi:acVLRF1 family peptidyl-tRNA hydrolase [Nocardioides marmoriginsengisoli]|uniref:acVLRF1 family peptidyl-tRNA hydrolase n=1 Tax=Nocardioides marmoriginsengisoli TaxID=661483 RepID=UPI001FE5EEBA|nr:acVLRF1 family peptidyl-tRNA hydrolase [Nocardioides marmoriginsengisoli]
MAPTRLPRWIENFTARHGACSLRVADGSLLGEAADTSTFSASLPFSGSYSGPAEVGSFVAACAPPDDWGVLLVRKGGFAVARLAGELMEESKVGQRHVQGRTKAGGQSQQRFARRRGNQARIAFEAAADHAARIAGSVPVLVVGGDQVAVTEVLNDPRLSRIPVVGEFLTVPDPRRAVLEAAIAEACAVTISVTNA